MAENELNASQADLLRQAQQASLLLKAMANEIRLLILCLLVEGERSVGALNQQIGISQSALSQHLAWLRRERLVACRREGQVIIYRLADPKAARVLALLHELYCPGSH